MDVRQTDRALSTQVLLQNNNMYIYVTVRGLSLLLLNVTFIFDWHNIFLANKYSMQPEIYLHFSICKKLLRVHVTIVSV